MTSPRHSDQFPVWYSRDYFDVIASKSLTLKELLCYFRRVDKLKSKEREETEVVLSDCSDVFYDGADYDSGISSAADEANKANMLSLRKVCRHSCALFESETLSRTRFRKPCRIDYIRVGVRPLFAVFTFLVVV